MTIEIGYYQTVDGRLIQIVEAIVLDSPAWNDLNGTRAWSGIRIGSKRKGIWLPSGRYAVPNNENLDIRRKCDDHELLGTAPVSI